VTDPIRAAGGVVWRTDGALRVALIRRDRYDDWSLPKGKLESGERDVEAAVREVHEEIGATVALTRRLTETEYRVDDAPKVVRFWAMRYLSGDFTASAEVDDLAWLPPAEARERLSHDTDRSVLDAFTARPVPESVVVLVRHAKAGKRSEWPGDDRLRPLDKAGRRQARGLAGFLRAFAPSRVVSADRARCEQTVEPFAQAAGLDVELDPAFADEAYIDDPPATVAKVLDLAKSASAVVICSQGTAVPGLVSRLADVEDVSARKGSAWVLCFADGAATADYYGNAAR
jgi:phosphohistidine phosphatase SixA/8-oxo-dGTP pyrophosphatase MutT (NUDIX family)